MERNLHRSILRNFFHLTRSLHRPQSFLSEGEKEVTILQMQAMFFIKHHQEVSLHDLAKELGITPASGSLLVDRLVSAGWIERTESDDDRRKICLSLSHKMQQKLQRIMRHRLNEAKRVLRVLSAEELATLNKLLEKMGRVGNA